MANCFSISPVWVPSIQSPGIPGVLISGINHQTLSGTQKNTPKHSAPVRGSRAGGLNRMDKAKQYRPAAPAGLRQLNDISSGHSSEDTRLV